MIRTPATSSFEVETVIVGRVVAVRAAMVAEYLARCALPCEVQERSL